MKETERRRTKSLSKIRRRKKMVKDLKRIKVTTKTKRKNELKNRNLLSLKQRQTRSSESNLPLLILSGNASIT